jgi:hypothetical protein
MGQFRVSVIIAGMAACLALAGCSSSAAYEAPEALCGIDVQGRHALLFPGDSESRVITSFEDSESIYSAASCEIRVKDETLIFSGSSLDVTDSGDLLIYDHYRDRPSGEPQVVHGPGYEAEVWPGFAMAEVPCSADRDDIALFVGIVANYPEDPEENQAALAELIVPYVDGVFAQVEVCDLSDGYRAEGGR